MKIEVKVWCRMQEESLATWWRGMVPTMTGQEIKTATPEQPTPVEPVPLAAPVVQPAGALHLWRTLGWVIVGALLAVGIMLALPMHQTMVASIQGETQSVPDLQSPGPAVINAATSTVRLNTPQMQHLALATVTMQGFREEKLATGKIAFNEEFMTPVFSPYAGRVTRVIATPGDVVQPTSPLLELYTPDFIQAQSDLIGSATTALAKAKNALSLARRNEERQHQLFLEKAAALKEWQQAQADATNAESDVRAAEAALLAARDKLRAFGKSVVDIARIEQGHTDRVFTVTAPLAGTITARKVGPGQFIRQDNTDPLFVIADLAQMWMLANVYETDVPWIKVGQPVEVRVMAYPEEVFKATITYIGAAVDPATHRVDVRAVVDNPAQKLKPEMFATFRIITHADRQYLAVPLSAVVRDGDKTSVWVAQPEYQFVRREVKLGLEQNGYGQILSGLQAGEQVATEGGLLLGSAAGS
jgi:cobalt-zinc-cadmium efflux system membrane fusion protein